MGSVGGSSIAATLARNHMRARPGTVRAPHRVCAMDPTQEHEHEHHDEQGAGGRGANAAAPSTTTSTTSLLGEEGGVVQELTEAMAAASVAELRSTPDPGPGSGPGPGPRTRYLVQAILA